MKPTAKTALGVNPLTVPKLKVHETKTKLPRCAKRLKAGENVLLYDSNNPFAEIRPLAKVRPKKPAKRRMGMDEGKKLGSDDWDSPATNAAIAALFGVDTNLAK